jgi:type I restriction enzyme R subunit
VGWQNDPQPKEKVRAEIRSILHTALPESYGSEIFKLKSDAVFEHIVDKALMGWDWAA